MSLLGLALFENIEKLLEYFLGILKEELLFFTPPIVCITSVGRVLKKVLLDNVNFKKVV